MNECVGVALVLVTSSNSCPNVEFSGVSSGVATRNGSVQSLKNVEIQTCMSDDMHGA